MILDSLEGFDRLEDWIAIGAWSQVEIALEKSAELGLENGKARYGFLEGTHVVAYGG